VLLLFFFFFLLVVSPAPRLLILRKQPQSFKAEDESLDSRWPLKPLHEPCP
jgi:hypothetical protein